MDVQGAAAASHADPLEGLAALLLAQGHCEV